MGPATLVSVGYIDPGNWATDLEAGARFGHQLLWVLVFSSIVATLLQTLSARLGVISGLDLASACRAYYPKALSFPLWVLAELAIIACDMAEILGSAVALQLLFGIPMVFGAALTVMDVFLILALQRRGARALEAIVLTLLVTIGVCLLAELLMVKPSASALVTGLVPRLDGHSLYIAIGILGATVMPHNLYLHSALVPRPGPGAGHAEKQQAVRHGFFSTALALNLALLLNAAVLVLAASVFSTRGIGVSDLREAHHLLSPLVGTALASVLFAVGLLCSGQSATITGTLAGQVVMQGFLQLRISPVLRRAVTRGLAVIPAVGVLLVVGEDGTVPLLIASQVVLSLQLPFAIIPLLRLTNSPAIMGRFANKRWVKTSTGACAALVIMANAALVVRTISDLREQTPALASVVASIALLGLVLLAWISVVRLRRSSETPLPFTFDEGAGALQR